MVLRWVSALVGIPAFVGVCLWGVRPFAVGVTILSILALRELYLTWRARGIRASLVLALCGLIAPAWPLFPAAHRWLVAAAAVVLVLAALMWEVARAERTRELRVGEAVANGLLLAMCVGLFGGLTALRARGVSVLLFTAICVWTTDSAALFVGRAYGRQKLAPVLSPHKTAEGAIGGFIGALIVGAVCGVWFFSSWSVGLLVGALVGTIGQMGDLFESALKREAGIKDFGSILPGHGGILDRFDSFLFVAPAVAAVLAVLSR